MSDALPEWLVDYVLKRDQQRADEVNAVLAAMSERERRLFREAAVMGYVHGRQHPRGADHPKDSTVLANVIGACLANADYYPVTNAVAKAGPAERTTLPDVLRGAADRIDAEDVPQTAGDTADFRDGVMWATAQLRAIAGEADAAPGDDVGWLPDWLVELARERAASLLSDDERAMLRYALELADDRIACEGDEFTDADEAARESLRHLAGEG